MDSNTHRTFLLAVVKFRQQVYQCVKQIAQHVAEQPTGRYLKAVSGETPRVEKVPTCHQAGGGFQKRLLVVGKARFFFFVIVSIRTFTNKVSHFSIIKKFKRNLTFVFA